ncbi:MAG: hypothetical protein IMF01_05700 [Proteobacteria bacterium]|nr:hypothetical protein [Pseudomonadota bacterium]
MQLVYGLMILLGIPLMGWGFWGSYNAKKPWDTIAALSLPIGMIVSLMGILLTCVPKFFKG